MPSVRVAPPTQVSDEGVFAEMVHLGLVVSLAVSVGLPQIKGAEPGPWWGHRAVPVADRRHALLPAYAKPFDADHRWH